MQNWNVYLVSKLQLQWEDLGPHWVAMVMPHKTHIYWLYSWLYIIFTYSSSLWPNWPTKHSKQYLQRLKSRRKMDMFCGLVECHSHPIFRKPNCGTTENTNFLIRSLHIKLLHWLDDFGVCRSSMTTSYHDTSNKQTAKVPFGSLRLGHGVGLDRTAI